MKSPTENPTPSRTRSNEPLEAPRPERFEGRDRGLVQAADDLAEALERQLFRRRPEPSQTLTLTTDDGYPIAADLYLPRGPARARLLLGPAMGVRRSFYASFLDDLRAHGIASMVIDYRGIGGSRAASIRKESGQLSDWGERDLAAAAATLTGLEIATEGPAPMLFVGHSAGGQVFGLMREAPFDAALFVGSQSGYWGHWDGLSRAAMAALWFGAVPLFTTTLGYLPMRALGQGENIPAGVAREWASWGRAPDYIGTRARQIGDAGFATWAGKLRAIAVADDAYAPERAVRGLGKLYRAADVDVQVLHPRDVGARHIGHFGWFSPRHRESLWAGARSWLLEAGGIHP